MKIIGLSGYARSGKDTVAGMLAEHGYERVAFADIMRECALALDPIIPFENFVGDARLSAVVDTYGWEEAKTRWPEVRRTLQRLGTEVGRNILGQDVWVKATMQRLDNIGAYAIADCRFRNEAMAVIQSGGKMWRIQRPGCGPVNDHPSETSLDDWNFDHVIENDGDLNDLRFLVDSALQHPFAHV